MVSGLKRSDEDFNDFMLIASDKKDGSPQVASAPSPIVNELDDKAIASFATGHPVTDEPDVVVCKHCKKAILKTIAASHTKECAKQKAEKLRKKKEAKEALAREKEAREAKEKAKETAAEADAKAKDAAKDKPAEDGEGADKMKTAKKGTVLGEGKTAAETKKSKKRKADEDAEKAPKQKKKKEEPKPKVAKPKGMIISGHRSLIRVDILTFPSRSGRCREAMRRPPPQRRPMCSIPHVQIPLYGRQACRSRSLSPLRHAAVRLPEEEPSQAAEYVFVLSTSVLLQTGTLLSNLATQQKQRSMPMPRSKTSTTTSARSTRTKRKIRSWLPLHVPVHNRSHNRSSSPPVGNTNTSA